MLSISLRIVALVSLVACTSNSSLSPTQSSQVADGTHAHFEFVNYEGNDPAFAQTPNKNQFRNPVLAGYHPDPSMIRVGDDYYLINSTFGFFPSIPIYHSRDMVSWKQIGNVIDRPSQLNYDGIYLSNNGIYAPAIRYNKGVFYVITTCVACGHNFVVTAKDPAGPWSDPIFLPHINGIDPSLFFDDDGRVYIVHHSEPDTKRYDAHTAIRVMEVDPDTFAPRSADVLLVDGGDPVPWHTDYLEGPHIYKVNGTYYLSAPGGGTGYYHSQLIFRSSSVMGPYEAYANNPILTQFGLADDRPLPITATGHGDMVQDQNGDWWMVFLGTRPYDLHRPGHQDPGNFVTGRETFMLPVTWRDGWPIVLEKGKAVPYLVTRPNLPRDPAPSKPVTGNYSVTETFSRPTLGHEWQMVRAPATPWWQTGKGLTLKARSAQLGRFEQPSFIGRRIAHLNSTLTTKIHFSPTQPSDEAGLLAVQNDLHYFRFGIARSAQGENVLRITRRDGEDQPDTGVTLAEYPLKQDSTNGIYLRLKLDRDTLSFAYSHNGKEFIEVASGISNSPLTSARAGSFTGALAGVYAYGQSQ